MASRREEFKQGIRFQIIRLLSDNPKLSTRQIAQKVGISNGAAFYMVNALIEKGFIKLGNFINSPKKGQYRYLLTPKGLKEKYLLTFQFLERKKQEYNELKNEIKNLEKEIEINKIKFDKNKLLN